MFFSCTDQQQISDDDNLYCEGQDSFVCDGSKLKICGVNGTWAYETCESVCGQMNLKSNGCAFDSERGHDFCTCEPLCCEEGAQRCAEDKLQICSECEWTNRDCEDYCTAKGSESLGCGIDEEVGDDPICICKDKGNTICPDNLTKCQEGHVNLCNEQLIFNAVSCRDKCVEAGYYFNYCGIDADTPAEDCHCSAEIEDEMCATTSPTCDGDDKIKLCEKGNINTYECKTECEELGLASAGCKYDKDRGHDACFCD